MVVYNSEDKKRIMEQLVALWNHHGEGMRLVGIRFDQTPVDPDDDEYPGIAIIWTENDNPHIYMIGWGECHYGDGGVLGFNEDDLESWSESGVEPWSGNLGEYMKLVTEVYPEYPEWEHLYMDL